METFNFFVFVTLLGTITYIKGQANVCDNYLVSGPNGVPDSQLNASTVYMVNDPKHEYGPARGRLNLTETKDKNGVTQIGAWSAQQLDVNQYIQVELNDPSLIRGVVTQGRHGCCKQWVKKYRVLYSMDCKNFTPVGDHNVTDAFFKGNSDEDTPETNMFECPVIAKCIRINPLEWNHHVSMRFDLIGCSLITGSGSQTTQNAGSTAVPLVTTAGSAAQSNMASGQTTSQSGTQPTSGGQMSSGGVITTGASQMTTAGAAQSTTAGYVVTSGTATNVQGAKNAIPSTTANAGAKSGGNCIKDCQGIADDDYQSCSGCNVYVTCSNGIKYDNRPCAGNLVFDDKKKMCDYTSATCP